MNEEEYNKIIVEIAEQCIKELSDEDIKMLISHPQSYCHHFNYGLYIRNKYIYILEK